MREILFRGKRVDNGEWVYGYFVSYSAEAYIFEPAEVYKGIDLGGYLDCCKMTQVHPRTVGQYTGLKDCRGEHIFEGDMIRHCNDYPDAELEEKGVVFWDEEYCGWRRTSNGAFHRGAVDTYRLSRECVYEVIGNIHDNPELLEVNDEI